MAGVQLSTDADFDNLLASNQFVVVKYFADWCGSCKLFAPKFKRVSNEERFAGIVFAEVNAELNPAARKKANVDNLPFLATFKNGELVKGDATSKEEMLVEMLENLTK